MAHGTVSLRSINGHFLCAINGDDNYCISGRTAIGNWEKFFLENLPGGHVALKPATNENF